MRELARETNFAFEILERCCIGSARKQQFDGGVAAHQRMARPVNHAHASFANFFLEGVLAKLFQFEFGFTQAPPPDNVGI